MGTPFPCKGRPINPTVFTSYSTHYSRTWLAKTAHLLHVHDVGQLYPQAASTLQSQNSQNQQSILKYPSSVPIQFQKLLLKHQIHWQWNWRSEAISLLLFQSVEIVYIFKIHLNVWSNTHIITSSRHRVWCRTVQISTLVSTQIWIYTVPHKKHTKKLFKNLL